MATPRNSYDSTTVSTGGIHAMPRRDVLQLKLIAIVPPADKPAVPTDKPAVPVKTDDATTPIPPHRLIIFQLELRRQRR